MTNSERMRRLGRKGGLASAVARRGNSAWGKSMRCKRGALATLASHGPAFVAAVLLKGRTMANRRAQFEKTRSVSL